MTYKECFGEALSVFRSVRAIIRPELGLIQTHTQLEISLLYTKVDFAQSSVKSIQFSAFTDAVMPALQFLENPANLGCLPL